LHLKKRENQSQFWLLLHNQRRYGQLEVSIGIPESNSPIPFLVRRSNCSLQPFIIQLKNTKIRADFGHSGTTSDDIANRGVPLDSPRGIGLSTSLFDILTVVCSHSLFGEKNAKIGAEFGHYCTTSDDMANRRLRLDSPRRIGLSTFLYGVLIVVCSQWSSGKTKLGNRGRFWP
jgi:hypothetical protein